MDAEGRKCLVSTVYLAKCKDVVNDSGDLEWATPEPIAAYVEGRSTVFDNREIREIGEERRTKTLVIVEEKVEDRDRVWLPDEDPCDQTLARQPQSIDVLYDPEFGCISHYEVFV